MSTLRCFCRWGEKKTRKLRTFALRVDRRATEAKFPKAARPAASNRKNQQQRLKRQNPNEIAELNSTLDLDSGLCSLLNPPPPPQIHQRDSPMREHLGGRVFAIPRMLCSSNASLATFLAFLTRFLNLILILFYFGLFSIVYLLFSISAGRLFTIRRWQRWKPCSPSFLNFSQVSWKLGSCNEEKRPTFAQN